MVANEVSFRYFRHPHRFSTYTDEPRICYFCKQERPGYDRHFYCTIEIAFVCEACLVAGRLAEVNARTNEGDWDALYKQITGAHPELDDTEIHKLAEQKRSELEHRTPHATTWQDFSWPAHCGDYCCYMKEAGKPDLIEIAPEGNVNQLFGLQEDDRFKFWWDGVRPDSPNDNSTPYSIGVYLFQCLKCKEYVVIWDCD